MEDLDPNAPVPTVDAPTPEGGLPSAGHDEGDPLAPEVEEENNPDPPIGEGDQDVEVTGSNEVDKDSLASDDDDNESLLSDVDEDQFQDFDPAAISLEDRQQIAIDDDNVKLLGVHKRRRPEGEAGDDAMRKKKKERRRDKTAKKERRRRARDGSEPFSGGEEIEGKRRRKRDGDGDGAARRRRENSVDESLLPPEEQKRRALDRQLDEALKSGKTRISKKDGIDLEQAADEEVARMARRMADAARMDSEARARSEPALHKLKILPEVAAMLNRGGSIQDSIVDPENDMLRSITFFLEPQTPDGALPAYAIQKELFAVLPRLPITREELVGDSRIGQCVLFYTKSKKPEPSIKRQAERLLTSWMSLMLKRSNDYKQRDQNAMSASALPMRTGRQTADEIARERALQDPTYANRARIQGGLQMYTVAPQNRAIPGAGSGSGSMGSRTDAAFRKIQARSQGGRR